MLKTKPFDVVRYLKTEDDINAYLNAFRDDGDDTYLPLALADADRAREAMTAAAQAAGVSGTSLYQPLSENARLVFETDLTDEERAFIEESVQRYHADPGSFVSLEALKRQLGTA